MAANSSTGMGQGAAQVFGASPAAQQYVYNLRLGLQQQQQEQLAMQKMLSTFDAQRDKMRPQDIAEFNQKYSELQQLYMGNKGLYRTPAKYPELYQKSLQLQGALRQLAAESVQQNEYFRTVLDSASKDSSLFDDETTTYIAALNAMPTSTIKERMGGSLATPLHFQYQPKAYDMNKFAEGFVKYANMSGGADPVRWEEGDGAFKKFMEYTKYAPEAAMAYTANVFNTDSVYKKNMSYAARNATQEQLNELQTQVNAIMGDKAFQIKDALTYAQAKSVVDFQKSPVKQEVKTDPAFAARQAWLRQKDRFAHDANMVRLRASLGKNKADQLLDDIGVAMEALQSGNLEDIRRRFGPISNLLGPKLATDTKMDVLGGATLKGRKGWNRETFKQMVRESNKKAYSPQFQIDESDAYLDELWKDGGSVVRIPITDEVEVEVPDPAKAGQMMSTKKKVTKYLLVSGHKKDFENQSTRLFTIASKLGSGVVSKKSGTDLFGGTTPSLGGEEEETNYEP